MKRLLIIAMFVSFQLSAQTGKGSFLTGGNVTASYAHTEEKTYESWTMSFSVSPKVGFFVADNLCLGIAAPFSFGRVSSPDFSSQGIAAVKSRSIGVGPFVRYYVPLSKFNFISEVGYSFSKGESRQEGAIGIDGDAVSTTTAKEFQVAAGLGLAISDNVMVELLLNYRNGDFKSESDFAFDPEYDYKRSVVFLSVGFQIYLPKKTE